MLLALLTLAFAPQGDAPIQSTAVRELPTLGKSVRDQRWVEASGAVRRRTTDAQTGLDVAGDAWLRAETAARNVAHGKLSAELRAQMAAGRTLEVAFWLTRPLAMPDLRALLDAEIARGVEPEAARQAALALAAEYTSAVSAPFAQSLVAAGYEVTWRDPHVPIVCALVPSERIAALAAADGVDQAYYCFPTLLPEEGLSTPTINDFASPSARTDHVHRKGITGAGVKVLVNDVGSMVSNNPHLPPIVFGQAPGSPQTHATAVAGIIASKHAIFGGAAPGLTQLFDHGAYGDTGALVAWAWGMQQGISFGNCSWWNGSRGSIVMLDRYFDYIIRNFGVMLFKSTGNQGNNQPTTSPGNGYNMLASGCADDRNTMDWNDDGIASFSSTANPTPGHEKPEVSAHGTNINTTTISSPWTGAAGSGTSFASPVTCGAAALLAETDGVLAAKPEVVKAVLMAGAWNNLHGTAVLSDYDGAGGIDAAASQAAVANGQYFATTLTAGSFPGNVFTHSISLLAGNETRIVALWFGNADSTYSTDVLDMDLDLTIVDPSGATVASSLSALNPFEIVGFVPAVSGVHQVKLTKQRFNGSSELLAIAWSTRLDAATDVVTVTGTPRLGATVAFEFFDRYHAGQSYVGVLSLTPFPATMAVSATKILELGVDALTIAAPGLPGFAGAIPAGGKASANLTIPSDQSLVGLRVDAAMVTVDLTGPELIEETSRVTTLTIQQ